MKHRSAAYYKFCQDMGKGHLSYYDSDEIEEGVLDLLDDNMIEEAEALAEHGMRLHPGEEPLEKLVIWIYLHHHKGELAEAMFQKYQDEDSEWSIRMNFAFEVMHGHPQKALEYFFEALKAKKVSSVEWSSTLDEMYEAIPLKAMVPYLIKAIELVEDSSETLGRIGTFLIEAHQQKEAITALEKALDIDAYDIFSWQDLSRAYLLDNQTDKCLEACEYGLAIDEKNPLLNFLKGYIHYQRGEFKECIQPLKIARQFAEGKIEARNINIPNNELQDQINVTYEMLATSYFETEQFDEATECYEILCERDQESAMTYVQLTSISLIKGDLNQAYAYVHKAVSYEPKSEPIRTLQVSVLTTMHKFDEAMDALRQLIKIKPKSVNYRIAYAELLLHVGQEKEADKVYRKMLTMSDISDEQIKHIRTYFERIGDGEALNKLNQASENQE